jgi:hypothetical protein
MSQETFAQLEKQAGHKAALILRKSLKTQVRSLFDTTQGNSQLLKATVLSKMKGPELQRLVIKMPHYGFKQHFGFDGVRNNGVKLRLLSNTNFINDAIQANNALENLVTEIGNIRLDEITTKIKF